MNIDLFSYSSGSQKSTWVCKAAFVWEALGKNLFSCFFQLLEAACIRRLLALPQSSECVTSTSASVVTSSLALTLYFSLTRTPVIDDIGLTRILQANLSN